MVGSVLKHLLTKNRKSIIRKPKKKYRNSICRKLAELFSIVMQSVTCYLVLFTLQMKFPERIDFIKKYVRISDKMHLKSLEIGGKFASVWSATNIYS